MSWDGPTYQIYYGRLDRIVDELLDRESADYLRRVDFDEYLEHLAAQAEWQPLEWDEAGWTVEPIRAKATRYNRFDNQTYTVEQDAFRLRVPVSPHPQRNDYLKFGPSTTRLNTEPAWRFEGDVLVHEVEATEAAVESGKDDIRFWLGNRNKDIELGNKSLPDRVRAVWENRRKRLEDEYARTQQVIKNLNIPLHRNPDAPVKPVEIKPRPLRTALRKPVAKTAPTEPTLRREDVIDLVTFIERYARTFEVTPKAYAKMAEEELRDLLQGMLNANYPDSATGETFRKLGKTDISFCVEKGHVLVCECKFWSGAKGYVSALEQLFGYVTWRESHGVLIHFCKLKDMNRAVEDAKRMIGEHESFASGSLRAVSETRFTSRHNHPQDTERSLELHHLFFDLSM